MPKEVIDKAVEYIRQCTNKTDGGVQYSSKGGGSRPAIIDLRETMIKELQPVQIPGARSMSYDEIEHRHSEIPRDREIILYCT